MSISFRPLAGFTIAAAILFGILIGLGVWQLQRAAWKTQQLKQIAALKRAPPQPIEPVFARVAAGADAKRAVELAARVRSARRADGSVDVEVRDVYPLRA